MKKTFLPVACAAMASLALISCANGGGQASAEGASSPPQSSTVAQKVTIDAEVTPFTLPNYDGKTVRVGDWKADGTKATLVIFVSTRCPVSNGYNERMISLATKYKQNGLRVFGINANKAETSDDIAAHVKQHNIPFPVLKDAGNVIADKFGAKVTPEAYLIDSSGTLRYHGRIDDSLDEQTVKTHDLQSAIDELLGGKPVSPKETLAFGCGIKRR